MPHLGNLRAYSTDDPGAVAAFRKTRTAYVSFAARLSADIGALGGADGAYVRHGVWDTPDRICALVPDESGVIPDGWRLVRGQLVPRRGAPGQAARDWLAAHQLPDVRHVLTGHGLPRHSTTDTDSGYLMVEPEVFEHDGVLWACYNGTPGGLMPSTAGDCTWTPRSLSEFHAAREAVVARAVNSGAGS